MVDQQKTAVVTGGEGSLGRALADELAGRGWLVHSPGRAVLDVTSPESVKRFFSSLDTLDLLISNAGAIADELLVRTDPENWDRMIAVNLTGNFLCAQAATKLFRKRGGGSLVFIGSRSGTAGRAGQAGYAAAKAGLVGLCRTLARELGPENIRVNVVCPGFLETKMTARMLPESVEAVRQGHALGRFNTVDHAARGIAGIAEMEHVSGQVFQLDSRIEGWA